MEDVKVDEKTIKENEVESTKSEMKGVREENKRLKTMLQRIESDYKALQMQFVDIFEQGSKKEHFLRPSFAAERFTDDDDQEQQELVSLRLGTNIPTETKKVDVNMHVKSSTSGLTCETDDDVHVIELGLGHNPETSKTDNRAVSNPGRNPGPDNRDEDQNLATSNKVLKTERSGDDDEFAQKSHVKRARVCVRARCDTPTMNDGCQWRKYGQKIAKGNPCPRAYYRCTVSQSCPVRKQVQRCVDDQSILITTYEGTHNHTLPISATTMASTTSAAASMLLSGPTTSPPSAATSPPLNIHGPPAWLISSSTTTPFSTLTLDLTTTNPATAHGGFSLYPSSSQQNPRTNLSFSSIDSNMANQSGWGNGELFYDNFRNSNSVPRISAGEQKYTSYLENFNQASSQQALTETLTKVITSDPSFRSVIAAVVSTMAANGGAGKVNGDTINGENVYRPQI